MKKLVLLFSGLFLAVLVNAGNPTQRNCSTMDNLDRLKQEDPTLESRMQQIEVFTNAYISNKHNVNTTNAVITIPVVFHVVYNTTAQNISDAKCIAQLNQLNLDFARMNSDAGNTPSTWQGISANTNIQFCLAQRDPLGNSTTGIERRQTTTTSFSTNDNVKRYANGGLDAWAAGSYLNIWSANLSGGVLGYAQFPGSAAATDGVVLLYSSIGSMLSPGTATPYHLGRTATHEVGHWLNLRHIWGDESGCTGSDLVGDTPNQGAENYGCPTYPRTDACSAVSPGVMFMNYMDYTDDACMNMFTSGQSTRMNALFATGGSRVSLLSSTGCQSGSGTTCGMPAGLSATNVTTSSATLNWNAVSGATSYNVQYKISTATTWTTTTSTTNSKGLTGLVAATSYQYQVQAVCASGSSSFSGVSTFTTSSTTSCGTPTGLSASGITTSGATLNWVAVSGATSYNVQYKTSSATTWTSTTSTTNSKALTGLSAATVYQYQVQGVCSTGTSTYSGIASFTTSSTTCSDAYESNNSSTTATIIPVNTDISALIGSTTDNDYFKFTTVSPATNIKITLTNLAGDYDIRLYNSSLTQLAISQYGGTTSETIIRNTTTAATYYIRVYGYNGAYSTTQCYKLRVNAASTTYRFVGENTEESVSIPAMSDLVVYPNPARDFINGVFYSPVNETIQIRLFDMIGRTIRSLSFDVVEGDNKFNVPLNELTKGVYFIELSNSKERVVKKFLLEN